MLRREISEVKRDVASVSTDLGIASASFRILNEETRSKVRESLRQSEDRRIELEAVRLDVATRFAAMEVKDEVDKEGRQDTKEHSSVLQRLSMEIERQNGTIRALQDAENERKKTAQTLLLQSRKMRWAFITAVAVALVNGVFALLAVME